VTVAVAIVLGPAFMYLLLTAAFSGWGDHFPRPAPSASATLGCADHRPVRRHSRTLTDQGEVSLDAINGRDSTRPCRSGCRRPRASAPFDNAPVDFGTKVCQRFGRRKRIFRNPDAGDATVHYQDPAIVLSKPADP
jgi:hypothetical protein